MTPADITIYHNARCSNSRGALALLRERGIEPTVVDYLAQPLDAVQLTALVEQQAYSAACDALAGARSVRLSNTTGTKPTATSASEGKAASPSRSSRASW